MTDYKAKSIIAAYSAITGNDSIQSVLDTLKKSYTFNEVLKGNNPAINYDSSLCNLLDIVEELSSMDNSPEEIKLITPESLAKYFASIRAANLANSDISLDEYTDELMTM